MAGRAAALGLPYLGVPYQNEMFVCMYVCMQLEAFVSLVKQTREN